MSERINIVNGLYPSNHFHQPPDATSQYPLPTAQPHGLKIEKNIHSKTSIV